MAVPLVPPAQQSGSGYGTLTYTPTSISFQAGQIPATPAPSQGSGVSSWIDRNQTAAVAVGLVVLLLLMRG